MAWALGELWAATGDPRYQTAAIEAVRYERSRFVPASGNWPFTSSVYLDSAVYVLVILVLLVRPEGLFAPARESAVERV